MVAQLARGLVKLKATGLSVPLLEQNLRFAGLIADREAAIETGRICYQGTMADLTSDETLRRAHLAL